MHKNSPIPNQCPLTVVRRPELFAADKRRVIARPFLPAKKKHLKSVLDRILGLSDADVSHLLSEVLAGFSTRHRDVMGVFEAHFNLVREHLDEIWTKTRTSWK